MKWALIYMLVVNTSAGPGTYDSGLRFHTFKSCSEKAYQLTTQVPSNYRFQVKYWRCLPSKD